MPGAPLEPGKALKEGGGPYGFPGTVSSQKLSCLLCIFPLQAYLGKPRTSVWIVRHLGLCAFLVGPSRSIWILNSELLLSDTVA